MIRQLSDEVQSHLRSGVAITSLTQCVEELIMNALDAGASCIAVRVDLPCFKVQAVDNGQGIGRDQLEKVGERYSTSKCHELEDLNNLQYFGYRGEAIASMRDTAAVLEINSRTSRSHQTYCKMFQKGVAQAVSESVIHRPSIGTTVTAHDLFYSLPVRKKNMNEALELERIRYRVEGIALIHPSVSFSLRNDINGNILLQTKKSSSVLTAFMHLFGTGKSKCLREVSLQKGCFRVEGFIGKEGHSTKSLQFLYVNGRLVLKTKVHKILNHTLGRSLVLKKKGSNFEGSMGGTQLAGAQSSSPPKQGDKYAMFVINVKCPLDAYDITFDPAKTLVEFKDWTALTDGIDEMVMEFLKKENLVSVSDLSVVSPVTIPGESSQSDELKIPDSGDGAFQGGEDAQGSESVMNQGTDSSNPITNVKDYTENISTLNASNCLFSERVRRPRDVMAIRRNQLLQDESLINQKDEDSADSENTSKSSTEVNVVNETPLLNVQNSSNGDMSKNDICTTKSTETPAQMPVPGKCQKPPDMNSSTVYSSESLYESTPVNLLTSKVKVHQSSGGEEVVDDISEEPMQLPESMAEDITASNPWEDSEDPLPSTLRDAQTKSNTSCNLESDRKAFICLPASPPSASSSGRQKLQNLHLISQKSKSAAAEKMCKRLGLPALSSLSDTRAHEVHAQKSAARKISERLVLNARSAAGKRHISAKLQKFKNTNLETRQCSNNPGASGDQTTELPEPSVREASSEQIRGSYTSIVSGESAKKEACHDNVHSSFTQLRDSHRTNNLPSQDDCCTIYHGEQIAHQQAFVTDVPSSSTVQDIAVVSTSAIHIQPQPSKSKAEQNINERNPVVPTLDDIEHLTSRSDHSDRKRFNPFALSTAAKLSKLARRSCVDDSSVKPCSSGEFMSSSSFVETPASVFKNVENVISDQNENKVETLVDTAVPDQLELPTAMTDLEAVRNNPVTSSSEKSLEGSDLHQNVTCERGKTGRTLLPFMSYSDRVCDRVDDNTMPDYLDVSETESVDSVILPHVDICSPEVSDQESGSPPAYCTQGFQPTGLPSQGFTLDVKAYDEDCQSGGFSPNVDRVTPMTGSPSSPAEKVEYVRETLSGLTGDGPVIREEEEEVDDPDLPDSSLPVFLPSGASCWNNEEKSGDSESEMTLADSCSNTTSKILYISMKKEDDLASESPLLTLPHSTFEDCPDFNSLTCGQRSPQQADSTKLTSTDDSFPLRKLLPEDSQDNEIQVYSRGYSDDVSDTMPNRAQSTCQQTKSAVDNSCIGVPMEVTPTEDMSENLNEIDENLAKEFDNEMTESLVDSREITLDDIRTKACSSNHGFGQCDGEQTCDSTCDSTCGPASDVNNGSRDLGSSCCIAGDADDQPSCSSSGTHTHTVSKPTWSDLEDPKTGKKIYVNSLTGNTMFEDQWSQCGYENDEVVDKGAGTLIVKDDPVPLSPSGRQKLQNLLDCHLVAESSDDQVKWRQPPSGGKDQSEQNEPHSLEDLFSSWNNPVMEIPQKSCVSAEVAHTSKAATRSFKSLYPTKFTKNMLKSFQVLGQVDNKFIACVLQTEELNTSKAPDLIVLFDQHAAHERVRLEQLTEDIYLNSDDVTDCSIKSSQVSPPRTLTFTEENVRLIKSFRDEFKRIGVTFTINGSSRDSLNIHSIPACLVEREANEVRRGRESVVMDIVETLIKDHLEVLKMMRGARSRLPQTIHKVLCSQACHGAIKFGDSLTLCQCRELLESLAECDLPFQCAHGRPSVMPLLSLQQLHAKVPPEKTKRPSLWKISRHLSIHQ